MGPDFPLTLTNVLWAVGAAASIAPLPQELRGPFFKNHIDNLKALKEAKDFKLPETLKALNEASERLKVNDTERKDYEQLKTSVPLLQADLDARSKELEQTAGRLTDAEAQLAALRTVTDDLWVKQGEGIQLIKPDVTLGLSTVHLDAVSIALMNKPHRMEIGISVGFEYRGSRYSVTLMEIDRKTDPYRARFTLARLST
jgi:hypothetical protein